MLNSYYTGYICIPNNTINLMPRDVITNYSKRIISMCRRGETGQSCI